MGTFLDFGFPATETHEGCAARRLSDGTLTNTWTHETDAFVSYVAVCGCGWRSENAHPPNKEGEAAAIREWRTVHMDPLVPRLARSAARRHVRKVLASYLDEALAGLPGDKRLHGLVAVASLEALREEAEHLLCERVRDAHRAGASWKSIGDALGIAEEDAELRFGSWGKPSA